MNLLASLGLSVIRAEMYLALAAMFLLLYGAYRSPRANVTFILVALTALLVTGWLAVCLGGGNYVIFSGMFISNHYTLAAKMLVLASGILVLLLSTDWLLSEGGQPFEFIVLMMFSMLGMMCLISAGSLLALYMSFELMSLPLYVLAAYDRDGNKSSEAGLKYFVLGALASGMMLYGISLVYGFAGTIGFDQLGMLFSQSIMISKAVTVGLIFIIVGFCFKLSAAPFHMWAPDVYEGAPTPVTAFFSTAPKVAVTALFVRLLAGPFIESIHDWRQIVIAASLLSMLVGAFGAIMQTNIKRLLAYSSIGHVGFIFMGLSTGTLDGVQSILIYLATYVFMSAGMFGCLLMMQGKEEMKDFAGLSKTHPVLAASVAIFMFSMAGIPPMSGFFGKLYVLLAAVQANLAWLAIAGVIISVVSCYYYLKVIKTMYFDEAVDLKLSKSSGLLIGGTAIATIVTLLFALLPSPLLEQAKLAAGALIR